MSGTWIQSGVESEHIPHRESKGFPPWGNNNLTEIDDSLGTF